MPFRQFGLTEPILQGVTSAGYTDPTAIQVKAIPLVMEGRDLIGCAQTGTGKTAAFALPILDRLQKHGALRALVLAPTRELASQLETAIRDYARFTDMRVAVIFGGVPYGPQRSAVREGVDILVATPGRLLDLLGDGSVTLEHVRFLVLDEADRMLDMGFLPDVKRILAYCPSKRQTMLFSATMPPSVETLCRWALRSPVTVEAGVRRSISETISHAVYPVAESQKFDLLKALLARTNFDSCIVFCRTKEGADRIAHSLKGEGHSIAVLHANRTQRERMEAMEGFRAGRYEVMVATDIAARGLDIENVSHVINYDVPQHAEDYVHRIGRTGRAEAKGDAFTVVTAGEMDSLASIERFIGRTIPRQRLEGFPYIYTALLDEDHQRRAGAKKRFGRFARK